MIYVEMGCRSWQNNYGMGRYVNELAMRGLYDAVICADSVKDAVPKSINKIVSFPDSNYIREALDYIKNNMKEGDIIHFPMNICDFDEIPDYVRVVLTVHDITPLIIYNNAQKCGNISSDGHQLSTEEFSIRVRKGIQRADKIITVSHNSEKDLISLCSCDKRKIKVIYEGISPIFTKLETNPVNELRNKLIKKEKEPIFLAINGSKHKNINKLIEAFLLYRLIPGRDKGRLVLVGKISKKKEYLLKPFMLLKWIVVTGYINDQDLVDYYNVADAFFFVSKYEGFGFPLLEAMRCGTKVTCSDNSSLAELGKEYSDLVDANSVFQIMRSFGRVNKKPYSDTDMIEYAKKFSWDTTVSEHIMLFNGLAED